MYYFPAFNGTFDRQDVLLRLTKSDLNPVSAKVPRNLILATLFLLVDTAKWGRRLYRAAFINKKARIKRPPLLPVLF